MFHFVQSVAIFGLLTLSPYATVQATSIRGNGRNVQEVLEEDVDAGFVPEQADSADEEPSSRQCNPNGMSKYPYLGKDSSERLLMREGVIDAIPGSLCGRNDTKNVILVIGDGMGWEMNRAGAIARRVLEELEGLGCDTKTGCPDNDAAKAAFQGRTLDDYYTEGKGSGLSYQELEGFALVTTTTTVIQEPNDGNHYAPACSLLNGTVEDHENGMSTLALNECGYPIDFSVLDYVTDGGNMVLWDDVKGGKYPW